MSLAIQFLDHSLLCYFELNTVALTDKGTRSCVMHNDITSCSIYPLGLSIGNAADMYRIQSVELPNFVVRVILLHD
jgi:hypothetical protein